MKTGNIFLALTLAALSFTSAAQASTVVNYPNAGSNLNLGLVTAGQSGTITDNLTNPIGLNTVSGKLSADTMITFTYNVSGIKAGTPFLIDYGSYNFSHNKTPYSGTAFASSLTSPVQAAFALSFASIKNSIGTIIIENTSPYADTMNFFSTLSGLFKKGFTYSYSVAAINSVSAVPLPTTLPLFLTGLGLIAFAARRKKSAVTALAV